MIDVKENCQNQNYTNNYNYEYEQVDNHKLFLISKIIDTIRVLYLKFIFAVFQR